MKKILFLLLFPCLCVAQYTGNAGQKITLGEQTTADGLVYRGLASIDTVTATSKITRANKQDTSAFILLDTVTNLLWHYKTASNGWIQAGGGVSVSSFSAGSTGLTPSTATTGAVTLGGTLAVANGGTGVNMSSLPNNYLVRKNSSGVFDTSAIFEAGGNVGIGTTSPTEKLHIDAGNILIDGVGSKSVTLTRSSGSSVQFGVSILATGGFFKTTTASPLNLGTNNLNRLTISSAGGFSFGSGYTTTDPGVGNMIIEGNFGIGQTTPTAVLHLKAGTATASTAPLKFTSGVNLTTAEAGAMEFNGTNLFFSPSTTRHTVNHGLTGSATLNFPSTTTLLSADLTITVTGAADGDVVSLGVPNAAVNANTCYTAWVSTANTVTVRFNNYSSGTVDPASALFKVFVTK